MFLSLFEALRIVRNMSLRRKESHLHVVFLSMEFEVFDLILGGEKFLAETGVKVESRLVGTCKVLLSEFHFYLLLVHSLPFGVEKLLSFQLGTVDMILIENDL